MATRIDIELTSSQDGGATFTWRAVGARQPKGVAESRLFPAEAKVGDEFRVETEMDVDGIRVATVLPTKAKGSGRAVERLELITRDDGPLVTQQLAEKGRRDGGRGRRGERGDRGDRGGERGERRSEGRERRPGGESRGGDRPRTPAKPKLPPKPKAPRLKFGKVNRSAVLDALPEEQRAVADEVLRGGLQAVRQGLATQNEERKANGQDPIDERPIVALAEKLLVTIRAAEWRDRADAALEQASTVDLRDLRSVVTAADGAAKDEETRALAAQLRTALNERLDAEQQAWVAEVVEMLDDDRVVRALHLSSRPVKAGAPLPAAVAMRLVEAANAAMSAETTPDRWVYILDALAHSPVRRQVVPVSLPSVVSDDLRNAIARHGLRLPEIAQIFGIAPDPKAGGADPKRRRGPGAGGKKDGKRPPKTESSESAATGADAAAPTEAPAAEVVAPEAAEAAVPEAPVSDAAPAGAAVDAPSAEADTAPTDAASAEATPAEAAAPETAPVEAAPVQDSLFVEADAAATSADG